MRESVSEGSSTSFWKEALHRHSTRQCYWLSPGQVDAVRWPLVGTALPRDVSVWPGTGVWVAVMKWLPLTWSCSHPVQAGRQMWGVLPGSAWAMHVTGSLLLQRLNYSRDCFQTISSKFPLCNNRNLIWARARSSTSSLPESHCWPQIRCSSPQMLTETRDLETRAAVLPRQHWTCLLHRGFCLTKLTGKVTGFLSFFSAHIWSSWKQLLSVWLLLSIHSRSLDF